MMSGAVEEFLHADHGTLAQQEPTSHDAEVNPLQFFLLCLAGWINRNQQNAIEYLQEEVKVLKEQLGKKPRFHDDQRRRLALKAKKVGLKGLKEIAAIATPAHPPGLASAVDCP